VSITNAELVFLAAVNRPNDDVSTGGGAIDLTCGCGAINHLTAAAVISFVSTNSGDTMNITISGRTASGVYTTETLAMNGTTEVSSVNTYQRILDVTFASLPAGVISVYQGTGTGTLIGGFNSAGHPYYKDTALFKKSASSSTAVTRYDKVFFKNTDASLTLTGATVTLVADPSGRISIGLETALNDVNTITNRLTAPAGITFQGVGTAINVPNSQNLTNGSYIGIWVRQALLANDGAFDYGVSGSQLEIQLSGNTT